MFYYVRLPCSKYSYMLAFIIYLSHPMAFRLRFQMFPTFQVVIVILNPDLQLPYYHFCCLRFLLTLYNGFMHFVLILYVQARV